MVKKTKTKKVAEKKKYNYWQVLKARRAAEKRMKDAYKAILLTVVLGQTRC